nr:serpin B3-like [Penaeus vannamei]
MFLTNAVYFKGFWKYPFKPQRTHKDKFFVTPEESVQVDMMSQTKRFKYGFWKYPFKPQRTYKDKFFVTPEEYVQVDMMTQTGRFKYVDSEKLHAQVLEMPYRATPCPWWCSSAIWESQGGGQAGPTPEAQETRVCGEGDALRPADSQVSQDQRGEYSRDEHFGMFELGQDFKNMGIRDLFSSAADLTDFTHVRGLMVNGAIHKALIEVDEEGAEAAAATVLAVTKSSPMPPKTTFTCNRPFVFYIKDNEANNILFMGVYRGL